jgi:hypothetical protein
MQKTNGREAGKHPSHHVAAVDPAASVIMIACDVAATANAIALTRPVK